MIDREMLYNDVKDKLDYWREIEKLCQRMVGLHEARLKRMEAERDGAGR